jgi:hypothetical protein
MLHDWINTFNIRGGIIMFSKETITKAMEEFRANMDKEGIGYDLDGDTIDLTIQGEVVHMWFNFMGVERHDECDEVLRLVDDNDAKWYVLATMLNTMLEEERRENEELRERIEELKARADSLHERMDDLEAERDDLQVRIDDMEAEEMAPSMIDGIDFEGGSVEDLIKYHSQVAGGSDEEV